MRQIVRLPTEHHAVRLLLGGKVLDFELERHGRHGVIFPGRAAVVGDVVYVSASFPADAAAELAAR